MKKNISFEEYVELGNGLKDLKQGTGEIIKMTKKLPKRYFRNLDSIRDQLNSDMRQLRYRMFRTHANDHRCQKCGFQVFEGDKVRVKPNGEVYRVKEIQRLEILDHEFE